ncbi:AAA domain-containing protein [Sphingomonas rubra]|uniref:AAA domain-containing protein n=2 Tax=Sphingomonas rubra TaxID=634430 RepID=A0A1I5UTV1_9SPHN|nr:AAA domain-containing protein [Sphingomonas rubra]
MKLWDLTPDDLGDRLYIDGVDSLASPRLKLAVADRIGGVTLQRPVSEELIAELKARRIDYLDVDPFVSSHSVDENDNGAIDAVSKEWVRIAQEANCAVALAHHVRKSQSVEASAFDARGAVSMINAARSVLVFQKMSKETAQEFGIAECDRKGFFSVYDDKNNKAPPAARSEWYEFVGVGLGNGDATGPEDSIGAVQRWEAPNTFGGVSARQLLSVQRLVDERPDEARKHPKARGWVGKLVAEVLGRSLDDPGDAKVIEKMIATWCQNGALGTVERANHKREVVEYVEVRQWAIVE